VGSVQLSASNTPGVLHVSVAEITLGLICALARHLALSDASFRAGEFSAPMGMELRGKTLGLIGFGGIGRQVAVMAHAGFGMTVLALGASPPDELARREGRSLDDVLAEHGAARYTDDLESVLRESDIVSLHIPATPETRHLISAERLAQMKPGALLINTARGAVLDEVAVYDALASGHLGGAALDVFEHEPYQPVAPDKDLRTLPNVLLTPHVGSNTREANTRMARAALENVEHFFAGRLEEMTRVEV
jgi:phosphoglycerate dehydrogenase-like enzyme